VDDDGRFIDEDTTVFSTYEEDGGGNLMGGGEMSTPADAEGLSGGIFGTLWDLFKDLTDDDED